MYLRGVASVVVEEEGGSLAQVQGIVCWKWTLPRLSSARAKQRAAAAAAAENSS